MHGTGPTIMLIGDSHAAMIVPAFTAIAQQHNLTLAVTAVPGCPWQQDLYSVRVGDLGRNCPTVKDDLYRVSCPRSTPT